MLFNSSTFAVFFFLTFLVYYLFPNKALQVPILILASFIFYAWNSPILLTLLLISILINTITSFQVAHTSQKKFRFFWAFLGVFTNLFILGLFKYGGLFTKFFLQNFPVVNPSENSIISLILNLPLPVGISFYTFQGISLVIDVWREQNAVESTETNSPLNSFTNTNFFNYLINTAFYKAFFPQLVAGPIVKAHDFYPQIAPKYFKDINWRIVFHSLILGYFLKMVVADNLKELTFWINYPYYQGFGRLTNLVFLFGYSMQIFADFAGYSTIAIGLAAALGYNLMENFNFPYISRSLSEFWTRWHISLSTWLKSYLYIPLGGNRKGNIRTYINLMIVMALGGLWHGATWSYGVWGIFHGIGLALERFLGLAQPTPLNHSRPSWQQLMINCIRVSTVFCFVSLGWLLFKLPQFNHAIGFLLALIQNPGSKAEISYMIPVLIFSLPVILYHLPHFPRNGAVNDEATLQKGRGWKICQDIAIGIMLFGILLNSSGSAGEFIYFQF